MYRILTFVLLHRQHKLQYKKHVVSARDTYKYPTSYSAVTTNYSQSKLLCSALLLNLSQFATHVSAVVHSEA